MRAEYTAKELIFDLALLESSSTRKKRRTNPALLPIYTEDGGHLNDLGSKIIAEQLLIFLATCARR
jgi:lysophospholipase L1-like esterase